MALEPAAVFLHRPFGTDAFPIAESVARPDHAIRAVLRTADGGVLVTSITRQADGTYTGEVYGVTPRQRDVALGDVVSFSQSQIFTFKTADVAPMSPADSELAAMVRIFDDRFSQADAHIVSPSAAAGPAVADFSFDPGTDVTTERTAGWNPAAGLEGDRAGSDPIPAPVDQDLSITDAYSILGAAEPESQDAPAGRVEPVLVDHAPPALVVAEHPVPCLECGAALVFAPRADGSAQAAQPRRVSCGNCGRINDVAQAEAANRLRRSA